MLREMEEITKKNFMALNQTIIKQRAEMTALKNELGIMKNNYVSLQTQMNDVRKQVQLLMIKKMGNSTTTR